MTNHSRFPTVAPQLALVPSTDPGGTYTGAPAEQGRGVVTLVAIDFETADDRPDSACSVAVVCIQGDEVTGVWSSLICPPREPLARNVEVNGLTWATLRGQPAFAVVGPQLLALLADAQGIIAHNAEFDRRVMEASCRAAGLTPPALPWICTVALARKAWPGLPNHKLPTVCAHLRIALQHHDAESDALAAASIYLAAKASEAPAVASRKRTGSEGRHRWCWTVARLEASLTLDGDLLFRVQADLLPGGGWTAAVHGKNDIVLRVEARGGCRRRLDELLVEALRSAVLVAKEDGWELSAEAWARIAAARPNYNPTSNALEVTS